MSAQHEACFLLLVWEFYLGHQQWIKQKSTLALLFMILSLAFWAMIAQCQKRSKKKCQNKM